MPPASSLAHRLRRSPAVRRSTVAAPSASSDALPPSDRQPAAGDRKRKAERSNDAGSAGSGRYDGFHPVAKSKKPAKAARRQLPSSVSNLSPAEVAAALQARQSNSDSDVPAPRPAKKIKTTKKYSPDVVKNGKKALSTLIAPSLSAAAAALPATDPGSAPYLAKHSITLSESYAPILDFASLPVSRTVAPAFKSFSAPTPIQACAWPPLLAGRDVVGIAETGSGKTLGFGVPALEHLARHPAPDGPLKRAAPPVLILSPTRELALQISATLAPLAKLLKAGCVCLYGGAPKEEQEAGVRAAGKQLGIVVATPGRLIDMLNDRVLGLDRLSFLVLDEADRMLDTGFEDEVKQIFERVPAARQTVFFSATWPDSVRELAEAYTRAPVRITVGSAKLTANVRVKQKVEVVESDEAKEPRLLAVLQSHVASQPRHSASPTRIIVFALYKKEAVRLALLLKKSGYKVAALHGDLLQKDRAANLEAFRQARVNVLVATDVAARGLDVPDVSLVVNVTFPLNVEDYVHRIGRAGRGGKIGQAVTFFTGLKHERALAGPFLKVLEEAGADIPPEMDRFPKNVIPRRERMKTFFADKDAKRAAKEAAHGTPSSP